MSDTVGQDLKFAAQYFRYSQERILRSPYEESSSDASKGNRDFVIKALFWELVFVSMEKLCSYLNWASDRSVSFYQDAKERNLSSFSLVRGVLELIVFSPIFGKVLLTIKGFELLMHLVARLALTLFSPTFLEYTYSCEGGKKKTLVPLVNNWEEPSPDKLFQEGPVTKNPFFFTEKIAKEMGKEKELCTNTFQKVKVVFWGNILKALVMGSAIFTNLLFSVGSLFNRDMSFKVATRNCFGGFFTMAIMIFFWFPTQLFGDLKSLFGEKIQ